MSDLSTPAPAELAAGDAWAWPTPPFAAYAPDRPAAGPQACQFEGVNGHCAQGQLIQFEPLQGFANVQLPKARTTVTLRFGQFRTLTLTDPVAPRSAAAPDPHARLLDHRPCSAFRLKLIDGGERRGETVGHVETPAGLFLFPPVTDCAAGRVTRLFVPREQIAAFEVGPRVGELLVAARATSAEAVEQAAQEQQRLRERRLGDLLLARQVVTPEQLVTAIEQQGRMPMVRIGEALVALGLVTSAQLDEALEQQKADRSVPIGELLVRLGRISRQDLQTALARKMGYPLVDVVAFPIEPEALRKLPYSVAARAGALPLLLRDGTIVVALEDPSRRQSVEQIEFATQCKAVPVLARQPELATTLAEAYARIGAEVDTAAAEVQTWDAGKLIEHLEREGAERADDEQAIEQSDNSLVRLVNTMIVEAIQQGVSDIHIESHAGRQKVKIRFRKDGQLRPYLELPHTYRAALIGRLKIMCDLDISERRKPQDGKINFAKFSAAHRVELRVATIPTANGLEDVVMRLLTSARPVPLDRLGMNEVNVARLKSAVERPYGLVLCVGPTGSGKTTTLHSALSHINVPERKIWTAEDPIEITQPGLRQVQVNAKIDWTFEKALRAFLRADPDVIMVGEVRDRETARTAIEASLTGHLVLSTLHTNSAPETVTRLLDMGMDPFNFADALLLVVAQRLVRKLCPSCRTERPMTEAEVDELLDDDLSVLPPDEAATAREPQRLRWLAAHGRDGRLRRFESPGCPHCNGTGFAGRTGIHELMPISRPLRRLIQTGARAEELQRCALAEGMATLRQDGIDKVLQGLTTIDEVRATSNV
ncbi:ATPase, T2SS/T4P/T4SS family [Caldimonas sp. KR1-144]|uniref:ATPase, T2SS/T4P/T4SS family n=1 Tax=Caldimonas sp. KR1-144 TaxID=3400911 RepID=UPI003C00AC44